MPAKSVSIKSNPKRGRPKRKPQDVETTRAQIGTIARDLFHTEGFESVSMRRLAREAKMSPMTLYAYFENKEEILHHVWSSFFGDLFAELRKLAANVEDPVHRLKTISVEFIEYWIRNPERYRVVFMSQGVSQSNVTSYLATSNVTEEYMLFAEMVSALPSNRDITAEQLKVQSELLVCTLIGIAHNKVTISGYAWPETDLMVDQLIHGIV